MSRNAAPTSQGSHGAPERGRASNVTSARDWVAGARPRTLPAAVVPVVVGTAVASADGSVIWWRSLYALIVALGIQIGTNYANDYADGIRGTDAERVGPSRLVAAGIAAPREVKVASFCAFGVAGVAGLVLALATTPWLLVVGAACFASGWFYSAGPRPYGYAGFGEIFVFVFFGLVAVIGTAYLSLERITALAVLAAIPVGLLATRVACCQQSPRHRHRPPSRQEHLGSADRSQADPRVLRVLCGRCVRTRGRNCLLQAARSDRAGCGGCRPAAGSSRAPRRGGS